MDSDKTTTLQFTPKYDVIMMREVVAEGINPRKGKSTAAQWQKIVNLMNEHIKPLAKHVSLRQVKDRSKELLKSHEDAEKRSKRASGVSEDHQELDNILESWSQLIDDFEEQALKKKEKKAELDHKGSHIRDLAMKTLTQKRKVPELSEESDEENGELNPKPKVTTPTASNTKKRRDVVEYLTEKSINDRAVRREELQLEEQRLKLQEEEMKIRKAEADNTRLMLQYLMKNKQPE